ncbi:MAG: hypothetical protein ABI175_27430 [Polyangiales bacterium]
MLTLLALGVTTPAAAHIVLPRLQATRRVIVALGVEPSLTYVVSLGPRQSFLVREEADENHDGEVDPAEGSALVDRWMQRIGQGVVVGLGSSSARPLGELRFVAATSSGLAGSTGESAGEEAPSVSVQGSWALWIDDGVDRLQVRDAVDLQPFEHTEIEVRDAEGRRFVGIGLDEQHLSGSPHLAFVDDAATATRVVWIVFRPAPRRPLRWWPFAVAIAVCATTIVVVRARRLRTS